MHEVIIRKGICAGAANDIQYVDYRQAGGGKRHQGGGGATFIGRQGDMHTWK